MVLELVSLLKKFRIPHSNEYEMQAYVESIFKNNNVNFIREHVFSKRDRVDFFVDGIAIECKVRGSALPIYRQLERYAEYAQVKAVILVTAKYMSLPEKIHDKPTGIITVGTNWL